MSIKKATGSLTTRYKKQHGLHHRHNNKYIKVYWPYIPVVALVITGMFASIYILSAKPSASISQLSSISVSSLFNETNQDRSSNKVNSLSLNNDLSTAAQEKANDMAIKDYWSPISPGGQSPWQIIQSTGYPYQVASENLAYGFSSTNSILSAWLNSPGHRQNMLNTEYSDVGFGVAEAPNFLNQGPQIIVVALYASSNLPAAPLDSSTHSSQAFTSASISQPNSQTVVGAESLLNKNFSWTIFATGLLVGVIGCLLMVRHGLLFKKWLREGENFVIKHPFLDIALVLLLISAASLSRTVGFIR